MVIVAPNGMHDRGMQSRKLRNRQTINVGAEGGEPGDSDDSDDDLVEIPDCNSAMVPRLDR
jgi:hypothetical protein